MGANTRQFDRIIDTAGRKLAGVQARESWALTASEQAKLAAYGTVVVAKGTRLKASPTAERGMDRIWTNAESRYRAEIDAAQKAKAAAIGQAATAKVSKKGWW